MPRRLTKALRSCRAVRTATWLRSLLPAAQQLGSSATKRPPGISESIWESRRPWRTFRSAVGRTAFWASSMAKGVMQSSSTRTRKSLLSAGRRNSLASSKQRRRTIEERKTSSREDSVTSSAPQVQKNVSSGHVMNRWWIVVGGVMMNMALGTFYIVSAFMLPLEKEFRWTRAQTSWVTTFGIVMIAISFVIGGILNDQKGPRFSTTIGAILFSTGFFFARSE